MATDDIQGTVVDENNNGISNATVYLFSQDNTKEIISTTTDSNGNYIFDSHPDGDGSFQDWHVVAEYDDGGNEFNTFSKPYVSSQLSPDIPDSGLLHQWSVSDGSYPIVDQIGSNDISQVTGGSFTADSRFYEGQSFLTDGTDDVAEGSKINSDTFTVSFFAEPNDTSGFTFMFVNGAFNDPVSGEQKEFPALGISDGSYLIYIRDSNGDFNDVSGGTASVDTLAHVVGRYDGSTLSLVVDTVEVGTLSISTLQPSGYATTCSFGARLNFDESNYENHFDGNIDFGLYYNRYLSDSEIEEIYNAHPST